MQLESTIRRLAGDRVRIAQLFMLCRQLGVILASIVIARSLSIDEVGILEMLMLCGYLMTFFWSEAILKGYLANPKGVASFGGDTSFLGFVIVSSFLAMILFVVGERIFVPLFVGRDDLPGLYLFAIYQAMIIPVWMAPFTDVLKKPHALLVCIYVLLGPAFACWVGYHQMAELNGILIGLVSYALVGLGWIMWPTGFSISFNMKRAIRVLWPVTWPLMLYAISSGLARSFDLWLVAREFSESTFAFFRYGAREFPVVVALAAGLSTIMIPRLKSLDALPELKQRTTRLMHIAYPLVALVMLCSPVVFEWVFGADYRSSAIIFNVYLLLSLTQLIFPQSLLIAREETKLLWYVSVAELIINIIASLVLLHFFGLIGIAFGTLIAFVSEKVILLVMVNRRFGVRPIQLIHPLIWTAYAVLIVLAFITAQWIFEV